MNNSERIQQLKDEIRKLEEEDRIQAVALPTPDEAEFATWLHNELCTANHTDGCSWYYEKDWRQGTHAQYLKKARKLLSLKVQTGIMSWGYLCADTLKTIIKIAKEVG